MEQSKLRKLLLLLFGCPLALLLLINCITSYIPPTEPYKKTPSQFEALFNEKMAQYGLSIDVDDDNFFDRTDQAKTVPIVCNDEASLTCTFFPGNVRKKSILQAITFRQVLDGQEGEALYLEPILMFMMDEFCPAMTEEKDETFETITALSYNDALRACKEFLKSNGTEKYFNIAPEDGEFIAVAMFREVGEKTTISIRFYL